ncbi:hypothetical protein GFO_1888 [Christiangramia forsetii KT0803]|uniref:Uncharacterized protein n=1 Tax=Christiangramia forsetii (strain DSM 17595 / CGMCC 1.15422 / KT0803) TaxID=411154 RepID=A0M2L3_CHRFK|nr:hypothetical protein GFO_1888 [Christiangramia forsetii KT0803]
MKMWYAWKNVSIQMKQNTYIFLLVFTLITTLACQRDDICAESIETTPLLIIRFYDIEEPDELKDPQNLSIRATDSTSFVINTGSGTPVEYFRFSRDSVAIPLKTSADLTEYVFTLNTDPNDSTATNSGLRDTINFTYGRQEEYINRACAYKVSYVGLKVDVDGGANGPNWIQDIQIDEPNVDDQNQAHVSIFF